MNSKEQELFDKMREHLQDALGEGFNAHEVHRTLQEIEMLPSKDDSNSDFRTIGFRFFKPHNFSHIIETVLKHQSVMHVAGYIPTNDSRLAASIKIHANVADISTLVELLT